MKNIIKIFLIISIFFNLNTLKAEEIKENNLIENKIERNFNLDESFIYFSKFFEENTPESYKYISLKYFWYDKNSELEKALKILVYNNKIPNLEINLENSWKKEVEKLYFYKLAEKILGIWFSEDTISISGKEKISQEDLKLIEEGYEVLKNREFYEKNIKINSLNKDVLEDVYDTLTSEHIENEKIDKKNLYYSAIKWLAEAVWDKYTTFFPPTESKWFLDWLSWNFEGIWTFVDMPKAWIFEITWVMKDWPAEKAWIKAWDIVLEVDSKIITEKISQEEIISWIRWEAWTEVILKIKRNWSIFDIKIIREKVHIKSIETKIMMNSFIIKINSFNENVSSEFKNAIEEIKWKSWIRKIIIDLRDNWGWILEEVILMLSYFIKKWEPVVNVKSINLEWYHISKGLNLLDLKNYEIIFLQNNWTASASEIMIWTMKDYFPKAKIIWEKSYWKGSVQSIKEYLDGSSLKYTTAKWFTWKTKTWIDWIWIKPDLEIKFDEDLYKKYKIDNQLEKALNI